MDIFQSLIGTFKVLGKIAILAGAGVYLRRKDYLDKKGTKMLGKTVMSVLLPALLVTKLADMNRQLMAVSYGIPMCCAIFITVGFVSGMIVAPFLPQMHPGFKRSFVIGCAFGNGTSLPIVMMTAILNSYSILDKFTMSQAIAYAALYMPVQHLAMWTIGYSFLAHKDEEVELPTIVVQEEKQPLLTTPSAPSPGGSKIVFEGLASMSPMGLSPETAKTLAFEPEQTWWEAIKIQIDRILNPPIIGVCFGLAIALVPVLHRPWMAQKGSISWVHNAIGMLGAASIPCNMICLGSNLAQGPGKDMHIRPIVAMCLIRLVWMPLVGMFTVYTLHKFAMLPSNRLILLTCMVAASVPTANNIVTIATALDKGATELSSCLFWQYLTFIPSQLIFLPLMVHLVLVMAP